MLDNLVLKLGERSSVLLQISASKLATNLKAWKWRQNDLIPIQMLHMNILWAEFEISFLIWVQMLKQE